MSFRSAVLVKQVPDTKFITAKAMNPDGTVNRAALPAIFNPEDLNALEAALQIKDRLGGTVTVITMGPPKACEVLRDSLYRGADRAILITDRRAAASDTLATSYILSQALKKAGPFDIVFCGRQAIDGDTAQVGPQVAEKLGLPQATYVEAIEDIDTGSIRLRRNTEQGYEIVEGKLPLLLTITSAANEPRPPSVKRMLRYCKARAPIEVRAEVEAQKSECSAEEKQEEVSGRLRDLEERGLLIEQWNLDDIGADLSRCGRQGSPTKVKRIQNIVLKGTEMKRYEPSDEDIRKLVQELIEDHTIG